MTRKIIALFFFSLTVSKLFGQYENKQKIDSIQYSNIEDRIERIQTSMVHNQVYFDSLRDILIQYADINPISAVSYFHATYLEAQESGMDNKYLAFMRYDISKMYQRLGHYPKAIEYSIDAIDVFKKEKSYYAYAFALVDIGNLYFAEQVFDMAVSYYNQAEAAFWKYKETFDLPYQTGLSVCYNNKGLVLRDQGEKDSALVYFKKGLAMRVQIGSSMLIAHSYNYIAGVFKLNNELDSAYYYLKKALRIVQQIPFHPENVNTYKNFGNLLLEKGETDTALVYFQEAYQQCLQFNVQIEQSQLLKSIALVYLQKAQADSAEYYLIKAYNVADNCMAWSEKKNITKRLVKFYESQGDIKQAYWYQNDFIHLDSVTNQNAMSKQQFMQDLRLKDKDFEKSVKQQKLQQEIILISFIFSASIALLLLYSTSQYRKIKSQKNRIQKNAGELESANNRLNELISFKQDMTNMLVHDLKNLLNGILLVDNYSKSETEQLYFVKQYGNQMHNLVLNILDVYKYQERKMELNLLSENLEGILRAAIEQVQLVADKKLIAIECSYLSSVSVWVDREIITRVLVNLLNNAIKYSPEKETITIDIKKQNDILTLHVKDRGQGVDEKYMPLIFSMYGQTSKTKNSSNNLGIGLAFCKIAIEAHGQKIDVISEKGKGAEFYFSLAIDKNATVPSASSLIRSSKREYVELSDKSRKYLSPFLVKLQKYQVYQVSEVETILQTIDSKLAPDIQQWVDEIKNTIFRCDQNEYERIVKQIEYDKKTDIDS